MSDNSTARSTGIWLFARGGLSLAVIATGAVVAVTRGSSPIANAATILRDPRDATVRTAAGASHVAMDGEAITAGEVVITGSKGFADLDTRGRHVLLSPSAALEVVDGEHQQLKTGTAVVDARNGAGLLLDLTGDTVSIPDGSATEASRGVSVRVGSLVGPASITSTTGRRLTVPRLYQALLSGDALPSSTAALHLTDSANETQVIPHVVRDDLVLKTLAHGIDTTGRSTAQIVQASWPGIRQQIPDSHSRSERVLPVLIADATKGGNQQQRYDDAVAWRAEGGSWGVVLHLLNGEASQVESTLASLQHAGQPAGQVGSVVTVGPVTGPTVSPTFPIGPIIGGGTTFPTSPSTPGTTGTPPATPPNLLGGLVSTLQSVIDGVLNLLPHDPPPGTTTSTPNPSKSSGGLASVLNGTTTSATSGSTPKGTKATPVVTPTPTSNGLLGDLLGGLLGKH